MTMGSEIDDVLITIWLDGYTHLKIEEVKVVNGRRRINLRIEKGKEELYDTYEGKRDATLKFGDQFNLTLSEGHPLLRNNFYDRYS